MPNIEKYNSKLPSKLIFNLTEVLFSNNLDSDEIEVIISVEQSKINIKELSTYLELIYRVDGYLSSEGLFQYSHYPKNQIEIDEIRFGSWNIVLKEVFDSINAERLILIALTLKYLPKIINTVLDIGIKYLDLQNKREDLLEKRDKRKLRKSIRNIIIEDESLKKIEKKKQEKLIRILEEVYIKNTRKLSASARFSSKSVKSIKIEVKKK